MRQLYCTLIYFTVFTGTKIAVENWKLFELDQLCFDIVSVNLMQTFLSDFVCCFFQRDQLSLLQKDIENLHNEREKQKKELHITEQQLQEKVNCWQNQVCLTY
jgi:hypothetical protein